MAGMSRKNAGEKMKVSSIMLLKTNGVKMSETGLSIMLMKTNVVTGSLSIMLMKIKGVSQEAVTSDE